MPLAHEWLCERCGTIIEADNLEDLLRAIVRHRKSCKAKL